MYSPLIKQRTRRKILIVDDDPDITFSLKGEYTIQCGRKTYHSQDGDFVLLTEEENEEYASSTITRHTTRTKFESKTGKVIYAFGRYQKLNRATIPINDNYFLLLALDIEEKNFDQIIMEKVIPLLERQKDKFIVEG